MNTIPDVTYEEFFIGEDKYSIRPLEEGDFQHDFASGKPFPDATGSSTTFGLKPGPTLLALDEVYDFNSPESFAYVAFKNNADDASDHTPVAYALCAENKVYQSHQFFISVDEDLKSTRMPSELLSMLANHAKRQDTKTLFCHADENNIEMRALAERARMSVRLETGKPHGVMYSMILDEHPGIVKF